MGAPAEDWNGILERLLAGDRLAFLRFSRLVTGFLVQMRAYDFEEEWDDLRQEVLASVVANARAGRLRDPRALVGYVRIITRNKFMDRLKRRLRHAERESLPWEEETRSLPVEPTLRPGEESLEERRDLWAAVAELPDSERRVLQSVYGEGRTYEEASQATGVPLGTLKRRLRQGLASLRGRLDPAAED